MSQYHEQEETPRYAMTHYQEHTSYSSSSNFNYGNSNSASNPELHCMLAESEMDDENDDIGDYGSMSRAKNISSTRKNNSLPSLIPQPQHFPQRQYSPGQQYNDHNHHHHRNSDNCPDTIYTRNDDNDDDEEEDDDESDEDEDEEDDNVDFANDSDDEPLYQSGRKGPLVCCRSRFCRRRGKKRHQSIKWFKKYSSSFQDLNTVIFHNLDNVWDSPEGTNIGAEGSGKVVRVSRKHKLGVLFWFVVLACAYSTERSTFKVLIDHSGPFRLLSAELICFVHALILGLNMLVKGFTDRTIKLTALGLPFSDVALMAVLDTIHILMCVLTVNHVSPILSVTLVQLTVPMTVCLTQCIHKNGACRCVPSFEDNNSISESRQSHHSNNGFGGSNEPDLNVDGINDEEQRQSNCGGFSMTHILGSCIIAIALLLGMFPSIGNIIQGSSSSTNDEIIVEKLQLAWSTVIFASSSIPAAGSILYKEHVLSTHKQPVDSNYLNFVLSSCQFIFLGIVFPLFYVLQGFGVTLAGEDSWMNLYPSTDVSDNFSDGLICFLGILSPTTANTRYSEPAVCGYEWIWIFVHVLSIMAVGMAVDKIVHAGATKILYRGISAGLLMAVIVMYFYTTLFTSYTYGPVQKGFDWLSTLLLLVGLEIYHRVALPEVTFETVYPHMDQIYED